MAICLLSSACWALEPHQVLVVCNSRSAGSRAIAELYTRRRSIPAGHVVTISVPANDEVDRRTYDEQIAAPVRAFLERNKWVDSIYAIVTTTGVPLRIAGSDGQSATTASVDSELAALYLDISHGSHDLAGPLKNPYFRAPGEFRHPEFPMYMVTRLTGYSLKDVQDSIERSLQARNRGVVVLDQRDGDLDDGNLWLKRTANRLPRDRVVLDDSQTVVRGVQNVIGYASWGSNDQNRDTRDVRFRYLPGAIVTEFVSTDGRTFAEPPAGWSFGRWGRPSTYFGGSPQSLSGDFIRQGATGVSGHVFEPYLTFTPQPDVLFPAYLGGRSLAESFYASLPAISWMNIVVGDPLCRLAPVQ